MKVTTYTYEGIETKDAAALGRLIRKRTGVCFADPKTTEGWRTLGVEVREEEVEEPAPAEPSDEEKAAQALEAAKRVREEAVAAIKVEVDGMTFDGDETSQSRMARAITAAETAGQNATVWVLADNTVAEVTKAQLQQALTLSMRKMAVLWTAPYEQSAAAAHAGEAEL